MEFVGVPYYKVLYNGKNITADISQHLLSLSYSDKTEGESDELQIDLEDKDKLWQNEWYPEKGSTLTAEIGMKNGLKMDCGHFMIDEIELSGPPDVVSIRALAVGIHGRLKTQKGGRNHEGKTLAEIVRTVASINGFTVQGTIADIRFGRIAQHRETDLQFLSRLAAEYGHTFSIRGKVLIFTKMDELESRDASLSIDRSDLISFSIKDKTSGTYKSAVVSFHNPEDGEVYSAEYSSDKLISQNKAVSLQSEADFLNKFLQDIAEKNASEVKEYMRGMTPALMVVAKSLAGKGAKVAADRLVYVKNKIIGSLAASITDAEKRFYEYDLKNYIGATIPIVYQYQSKFIQKAKSQAANDDVLEIKSKAENQQQAELKAKSALHRANTLMQSGSISIPGNILMVAGNNFELTGLGELSGRYHILNSTHNIDKSGGYTVDAEIKRVGIVPETDNKTTMGASSSSAKPKQKQKVSKPQIYVEPLKPTTIDFNTLNKPEGWL